MKTSSAKAKGRRLAERTKKEIISKLPVIFSGYLGLTDDDITVTPSGVNGPDLQFSPRLREFLNFDVECKNQERLNIWSAITQVSVRSPDKAPLLVIGKNKTEPWAVVPLKTFLRILNIALQNEH